tara:strand:- start:233 stop:772 length:540 start_codon:yes stop_codon:yes gene_type:complete
MATIISGDSGGTAVTTATQTVLQTVNKVVSTQGSQTINTTDSQVGSGTDFDISITPLGSGSKFIISVRWFGEVNGPEDVVFNLQRGGTRINTTSNNAWHGLSKPCITYGQANNFSSTPEIMYLQTVDSTGSTIGSAITYTLVVTSDQSVALYTNRSQGNAGASGYENGISELQVVEISA